MDAGRPSIRTGGKFSQPDGESVALMGHPAIQAEFFCGKFIKKYVNRKLYVILIKQTEDLYIL